VKPLHKKGLAAAAQVAVIMLAHLILIHLLAEKDIVATILSAGQHSPTSAVLVAGLFVVVRVMAVLLLPGIVLSHLAAIALERWTRQGLEASSQCGENTGDEQAQSGT